MRNHDTHLPFVISDKEIVNFIYFFEVIPWSTEIMQRSIDEFTQIKKQDVITIGRILRGERGGIFRQHGSKDLLFTIGDITIAVKSLKSIPFELT